VFVWYCNTVRLYRTCRQHDEAVLTEVKELQAPQLDKRGWEPAQQVPTQVQVPQAGQSSNRVGEGAEADTAGLKPLQGTEAEEAGWKVGKPVAVDVCLACGAGFRAIAQQQYLQVQQAGQAQRIPRKRTS
jgi:hypothetical protein